MKEEKFPNGHDSVRDCDATGDTKQSGYDNRSEADDKREENIYDNYDCRARKRIQRSKLLTICRKEF